ncbi:MAG TPA: hypothetical protein VM935_13455 [Chitinophagaceae bacterium]|jgi:hypothetical protein|nr:hypothetical protein [Chitinophagaceae bacterium]
MRKNLSFLFLFILFALSASAQPEHPPADVSFVIGVTANAPAVGTTDLILAGSSGWNARLYRGRLKQSLINEGSGIYYTKLLNSDTIRLVGDTWHKGELVQVEFYRNDGTLSLNHPTVITEDIIFAYNSETGTPLSPAGSVGNPGGWSGIFSRYKATGVNSYIQFVPNSSPSNAGYMFFWLIDSASNSYQMIIDSQSGYYEFQYNNGGRLHSGGVNLMGKYIKFKKTGTSISVEYSTTPTSTPTTLYTFPGYPISATSGISLGLVFEPVYSLSISNAQLSGQTIVPNE